MAGRQIPHILDSQGSKFREHSPSMIATSPGLIAATIPRSWVRCHCRALHPNSPAASQSFTFHTQQANPHITMEQGKPCSSLGFESGPGHDSNPLTLWGFTELLVCLQARSLPAGNADLHTRKKTGTSASEAVGRFYLDNARTRTDS